jgi:hypothetical protein
MISSNHIPESTNRFPQKQVMVLVKLDHLLVVLGTLQGLDLYLDLELLFRKAMLQMQNLLQDEAPLDRHLVLEDLLYLKAFENLEHLDLHKERVLLLKRVEQVLLRELVHRRQLWISL